MGYKREAIKCGGFEGAIDEKGVVMADECWRNHMLVAVHEI